MCKDIGMKEITPERKEKMIQLKRWRNQSARHREDMAEIQKAEMEDEDGTDFDESEIYEYNYEVLQHIGFITGFCAAKGWKVPYSLIRHLEYNSL